MRSFRTILFVIACVFANLVSVTANAQDHQGNGPAYQTARYLDQRHYAMTRRHYDRRTYRPVHRHVERYRVRMVHRHVERHHYRPAYRQRRENLAQPVYYYDGTLVGRDPDANIRLMLLKDNARTMWAR